MEAKKKSVFHFIYNFRRKLLFEAILVHGLRFFVVSSGILILLFLSHQLFFFIRSPLQFFIPIFLVFLAQSTFFYRNYSYLIRKTWKKEVISHLDDSFASKKDRFLSLIDLEEKRRLSELEKAYLEQEQEPAHYSISLPIKYVFSFFIILLFFASQFSFDSDFLKFTRTIVSGNNSKSDYFIKLHQTRVKALADSTLIIEFHHNIPSVSNLVLKQESSVSSDERIEPINFQKNSFRLSNRYFNKGKAILESRHSILGKIQSDTLYFEFLEAFRITKQSVRVKAPAYSKLKTYSVSNISDISVLKGSEIQWTPSFSKKLLALKSPYKEKDQQFSFRIMRSRYFEFTAMDLDSQKLSFRSEKIKIIPDKAPILILNNPTSDINVSDAKPVFFYLSGIDDFGFTKVSIRYYTLNKLLQYKSEWKEKVLFRNQANVFQKQIHWPITNLDAFPGMDIYYKFIAWDNNYVSGFQKAETQIQKIHLLSMEEIFAKMNEKQDEIRKDIAKNTSKRSEIISKIERYRLKMKQKGKLSFNDKKDLDKLFTELDELNKQAKATEKKLENLQKEAEKNDIFSEHMVDQFKELQALLKEMNLNRGKKKKKSAQEMSKTELQKEISDVTQAEKKMKSELERIKSLLEKLKEKQLNQQLLAKLKEFSKEQKTINRLTKSDEKKSDKEQEQLAEKLKRFQSKKERSELKKKMNSLLKKKQLSQRMKSSLTDEKKALKREEIAKDFESIQKEFQKTMEEQNSQEKEKLVADMFEVIQKVLDLSFRQEGLVKEAKNVSIYSERFKEFTRSQQLIKDFSIYLRRELARIANQSLLFNPKVINVLTEAIERSASVIGHLEQRRNRQAARDQEEILGYFNQAVLMLNQNKNSMQSATSALGEKEFMKQMQQLSQAQQGLNQSTQSMWDMLKNQAADQKLSGKERLSQNGKGQQNGAGKQSGGQENPGGKSGNGKGKASGKGKNGSNGLGGEQSQIADQLSDLLKEGNGQGQQAGGKGRGSAMLEEMRKIAQDLKMDRLNEDLIKRQKKLLQKMLDAASAGREKDKKTKRREKEAAKDFLVKDVKKLNDDLGQKRFVIQDFYEKAMKENYQANVKRLIEHYFNNLMKLERDSIEALN